ncbi:type II secretion system protein [Candidatus Chazhemtobacterium aquaticus]|uniref:Type IV pilus assembly protein PilA n=1 Tax=Candidatus Chazhemtobacterium aquaticus TaxID=2715735 RepID=A0A857N6M4_9BACT|nr:type II secretion system protein [Candidatus Chazhemtobacterium aquaticus]QHO63664.1 Type IV pilus assembly protein PilA [Candidatus Chazhemtobacterium aquaticus]
MLNKNNEKGFTLIELLVVVGIIGILTALVTVNLQGARERARDAQRKGDLDQVQKALELYKNDQNPQTYPSRIDYQTVIVSGGYMKEFPIDPTHRQVDEWPDYWYYADLAVDPLEYFLIACLENAADPDADKNKPGGSNNSSVCTNGYSYTLTEP